MTATLLVLAVTLLLHPLTRIYSIFFKKNKSFETLSWMTKKTFSLFFLKCNGTLVLDLSGSAVTGLFLICVTADTNFQFSYFSGNTNRRFLSVYFQVKEHHIVPNLQWIDHWTTDISCHAWINFRAHIEMPNVISQIWHPLRYQNDVLKDKCYNNEMILWFLIQVVHILLIDLISYKLDFI